MKVLLIVGGVLFLGLSFLLLVAAAVMFFVARSRRTPATAAAVPPAPLPAPLPTPAPAPRAADPDGTVVIDPRQTNAWGTLEATSGPLSGRVFPIPLNGFYIGRDVTVSQVVVDSPSVSKRHVWVGVKNGNVMAVDQASTNGTYLNTTATKIGEIRLAPNDVLILSDDVARFTYRV